MKADMSQHESTYELTNTEDSAVQIIFEPFGMPYEIPPGKTLRVVARSEIKGELTLDDGGGELTLYSWPTSTSKVYLDNELLDDYHLPVPGIPEGMAMPEFMDLLFRKREPEQD